MAAQTLTVPDLAGEAYDWFETAQRNVGEPGKDAEDFTRLKEGAPDWLTELVREAHGNFLPDDYRYEWIREALGYIHDNAGVMDVDDMGAEFADDVDIYNAGRLEWLASNLERASYCDEAVDEFGTPEPADIYRIIGMGQYMERREVFDSVRSSLAAELENRQEDEADA